LLPKILVCDDWTITLKEWDINRIVLQRDDGEIIKRSIVQLPEETVVGSQVQYCRDVGRIFGFTQYDTYKLINQEGQ
jgi:hypothetical protein